MSIENTNGLEGSDPTTMPSTLPTPPHSTLPTSDSVPAPAPVPAHPIPRLPSLSAHLYHVGFREGRFHDILLHVPAFSMSGGAFQLHRLVIARSARLAQLLESPRPDPSTLLLPLADPNITPDAFSIALGWLYAEESIEHMHPGNATAVLASAHALALPDLADRAIHCILQDIRPDSAARYAAFVDSADYPPHSARIADHLLAVLAAIPQSLPRAFPASAPLSRAERDSLILALTSLPFPWFKRVLELPHLSVATDHERYYLAKECVGSRRTDGRDGGMEENVVLAFGGGSGGVTIVRRPGRVPGAPVGRTLWKVEGQY